MIELYDRTIYTTVKDLYWINNDRIPRIVWQMQCIYICHKFYDKVETPLAQTL